MSRRDPVALAQAQLDAYNARDLDAFLACYDANVEVRRLPSGRVVARGREAMRPIYADLFARAPDLHCELLARIPHGAFVVDHERVTGMPGRDAVHAVAIYQAAGAAIRRVWFLDAGGDAPAE